MTTEKEDVKALTEKGQRRSSYNNKMVIQQEDIGFVNICTPNRGEHQHRRQILTEMKGELDSSTIRGESFITALSTVDRSSRWNANNETLDLNHMLGQMDLTDIFKHFV